MGAYVRIPLPFTPVPITLQVFFVLLSGLMLGPVYGTASQLLYVGLGGLGLPMFTVAGAGLAHLLGPTGGYIFGFVFAQSAVGIISGRGGVEKATVARAAAAMAAGILIIYAAGAAHLMVITGMSFKHAILAGALPFIPGEIIKAACAAAIFIKTKNRIGEIL